MRNKRAKGRPQRQKRKKRVREIFPLAEFIDCALALSVIRGNLLRGSNAGPRPQQCLCLCVCERKSTRKVKDRQDGVREARQGAFQSFEHRRKWKRFNFGACVSV